MDSSDNWLLIGVYSDDNLIVGKGPLKGEFQIYFNSKYSESPDSGEVDPGVHEFLGMMIRRQILANGII